MKKYWLVGTLTAAQIVLLAVKIVGLSSGIPWWVILLPTWIYLAVWVFILASLGLVTLLTARALKIVDEIKALK